MTDNVRYIGTEEELKILSDPFRLRIISTYVEYEKPLTVKGCADILNEVPSKVHYHIKKLLKIGILELDHVEVINGINAKYYYLPKTNFELQIDETANAMFEKNLDLLKNVSISQIENFRMDFINSMQSAIKNKVESKYDVGFVSTSHLYLSEEEHDELQKMVFDFILGKQNSDENKRKYSYMLGVTRKK